MSKELPNFVELNKTREPIEHWISDGQGMFCAVSVFGGVHKSHTADAAGVLRGLKPGCLVVIYPSELGDDEAG